MLRALEVDLPNSGGTDGVCKVVSFTPFYPGKPRNTEKEQPQILQINFPVVPRPR